MQKITSKIYKNLKKQQKTQENTKTEKI